MKQPQPGPPVISEWVHQQASPTEAGHWVLSVPLCFCAGFSPSIVPKLKHFADSLAKGWGLPGAG